MNWVDVLTAWGYPYPERLAPTLEELGFDPESYTSPFQLGRDLRKYTSKLQTLGFDIPPDIKEFLEWLLEQFKKFIQDNIAPLSLMVGGGIATIVLPKKFKLVGVIPVIGGVYLMLRNYGVI